MRTIKYISMLLSLFVAFAACSDDLSTVTYDPNNASPGELLPVGSEYLLSEENASEVVETFKWGKMDFGYQAAINYYVEVDLQGKDFANAQEVTAVNSTSAEVTVAALNKAMLELRKVYKFQYEAAQSVEFRVKGSVSQSATPVYSNAVQSVVTAYFTYNKVWVIGDFCGWGHGDSQFLYEYDEERPNVFEAWIDFGGKAQNGFKVTGAANWDNENWGTPEGASIGSEPESIQLINDGGSGNISVYSNRYYKFSFNTSTSVLTRLETMNSLRITGSAVGGSDIVMDFDNKAQEFFALATVANGNIKFSTDDSKNYGKGSADGTLVTNGQEIAVSAGTYEIRVNLNNSLDMKYRFEEGEPVDPDKITPQELDNIDPITVSTTGAKSLSWSALDFGDQEEKAVTYVVEIDLVGADFANAKQLGSTAETSLSIGGEDLLAILKELDSATDLGVEKEVEIRVVAAVTGLPDPVYSNVVSTQAKVVEISSVFMVGEEFGNWDWGSAGIVEMTPVNGSDTQFWTLKYFTEGKEFKWSPKRAWNGDFNQLTTNEGFEISGGNATVSKSGLYMVSIDQATGHIKFEEPQVYGMGDAFGSWDAGQHLFAVEDNKVTYSPTLAATELRMYASSSIFSADWWKMEFILRDGEIEYRGNGGDQHPRVSIDADKKIVLEFATDSGSIE